MFNFVDADGLELLRAKVSAGTVNIKFGPNTDGNKDENDDDVS